MDVLVDVEVEVVEVVLVVPTVQATVKRPLCWQTIRMMTTPSVPRKNFMIQRTEKN